MLLPAVVLALIALGILVRRIGGTRPATGIERLYVALAPAPFVLALVIPAVIGLALGFGAGAHAWIRALTWSAIGLSLLLGAAGVALVVRAAVRGERWGWPLGAMTVLASVPLALVALTYVLFWLAARL
ncbi:MAG: hypothetical protein HYU41_10705 [Candidatus Rokubacteria bacterium]|nr:hypothetical protein [Candidatus Rokubacteria bacterium]